MVEATPWRRMTHEQARARLVARALPDFWVGDVDLLQKRLARVASGEKNVIAYSPGGRPLDLVTYGEHEPLTSAANFNSAVGAREPDAYLDKKARRRPVVFFVGPVHGHEVEGLTGLVNLIHVMETGADLRGVAQPELRGLARRCRVLILPTGNPDGVARFEPRALQGMEPDDVRFWGQGTWSDDRLCGWPQVKRLHPMRGEAVGFLGCYFDDAGVNPMHDEFTSPFGVSAPAILDVARREGPDITVSLHSSSPPPWLIPAAYSPIGMQKEVSALAESFHALLEQAGLPHGKVPQPGPETGPILKPFNLVSALHHASGTVALAMECPHGLRTEAFPMFELEELLDMQLSLYRAVLSYALEHSIER